MGDALLKSPRAHEPKAPEPQHPARKTAVPRAEDPFRSLAPGEAPPSLLPAQERAWAANLQRAYGNRATAELLGRAAQTGQESPPRSSEGSHLTESSGPGRPLDSALRATLEPRFRADFSDVEVYKDDPRPGALKALAYTQGHRIYFAPNQYDPRSLKGQHLIAHELAHVVQQRAGTVPESGVGEPGDVFEREADAAANAALRREPVTLASAHAATRRRPERVLQARREEDEAAKETTQPAASRTERKHHLIGQPQSREELRARVRAQVRRDGGITVAVYIGDESGNSAEFRVQAYAFAGDHGALGVGDDGGLVLGRPMEMIQDLSAQLGEITKAAEALLSEREENVGPAAPGPTAVRVKTLAIFTHGWEEGIRAQVDAKKKVFSNQKTHGLAGEQAQARWAKAITPYLTPDVRIALYACRAGGDTAEKVFTRQGTEVSSSEMAQRGRYRKGHDVSLPFAERLRKEIAQGLRTRDNVEPASIRPTVWAHFDRGHVTVNARMAEFDGGVRSSFIHLLAEHLIVQATQGTPHVFSSPSREEMREILIKLGADVKDKKTEKVTQKAVVVPAHTSPGHPEAIYVREIPYRGMTRAIREITGRGPPSFAEFAGDDLISEAERKMYDRAYEGLLAIRSRYNDLLTEKRERYGNRIPLVNRLGYGVEPEPAALKEIEPPPTGFDEGGSQLTADQILEKLQKSGGTTADFRQAVAELNQRLRELSTNAFRANLLSTAAKVTAERHLKVHPTYSERERLFSYRLELLERIAERGMSPFADDGIRLEFDGRELRASGAGSATFPAVSGRPLENGTFAYTPERERLRAAGPIPQGTYWIDMRQIQDLRQFWRRKAFKAAWGEHRITIHPFDSTRTFGRGGFFIHGGAVAGSAGCIDLTSHIQDFAAFLVSRAAPGKKILLTVRYPG